MRKLPFYARAFLIDRRIWLGIWGVVLVAVMMSYTDFQMGGYRGIQEAAAYYYYLAFNQNVAMATYLMAASQSSVTLFCEDYNQNRLPFLLPRTGYWRYALSLVGQVIARVYVIGLLAGALLLGYFLTRVPLVSELPYSSVIADMSNTWLYSSGQYIVFYFLMISNIGLMLAFYALLGLWMTVYYPNRMTSYMMPIFWWFLLTEFRLVQVIPFFLFPPSVFSTGNTLVEAMTYYQFGNEALRQGVGIIYPYIFLLVVSLFIAWAIKVALERQWYFYEREGII